ncbi:MAG: peptidase [Hydrogenophilales bacterium 28-61-23]|nr:MAG: peptidase [Hydrogenophilales bacterium 28-61-23]
MQDEEVLAAMRLWIENAVIGLNLCPFAKSVYVKNQVRFVVSHARHLDAFLEELDAELDFLAAADPAQVDTTLLIHPTLLPDFLDFNDFTELAEAAVAEHGLDGVIQVASFHPRFQFADTEPDDIGNYTNRAPFPTLHLIREESLARAVEAIPNPEEIFERNIETLQKLGLAGWRALGLSTPAPLPPEQGES